MKTAQKAKEPLHPSPKSKASGTLIPEAMAANRDIPVDNIAVINPNFSGIFALKKGIISTLAITIPIPVNAVPIKSNSTPPKTRITTPNRRISNPRKIALPCPKCLPIRGAKSENKAKVIRDSVVKKPANPLEIPKSSLINGIKGPTEAIEVRRLIEIKTIPKINRNWVFRAELKV